MGLEERFDISVPEEDLENVGTVGQAVDLVLAKRGRQRHEPMVDLVDSHGRPRVVVTGMGVKTPAGVDVEHVLGRGARRSRHRQDHPALRRVGAPGAVRRRGPRLRPDALLRPEGGAPGRPLHAARASAPPPTRSTTPASSAPTRAGVAVIAATGVGGLETMEENESTFLDTGPEPGEPVLRADDDAERDRRDDLDPLRLHRARTCASSTACAAGANAIGEGVAHGPRRQRRRRRRRWHRGGGHPAHGVGASPAWAR